MEANIGHGNLKFSFPLLIPSPSDFSSCFSFNLINKQFSFFLSRQRTEKEISRCLINLKGEKKTTRCDDHHWKTDFVSIDFILSSLLKIKY